MCISTVVIVGKPAAFVASDLSITPARVGIGKEVTISALVTNTGDLSGSYKVTLKVDNVIIATKAFVIVCKVYQFAFFNNNLSSINNFKK